MKDVILKIRKYGLKPKFFKVEDDLGNVLLENVSIDALLSGIAVKINDSVKTIKVTSLDEDFPKKTKYIPITRILKEELPFVKPTFVRTSSTWTHVRNNTLYNKFYGLIKPYVIEYPFSSSYFDSIVQSIQDFTKAYKYLDNDYRVEQDRYFNKAIIYNDSQCSGLLVLEEKPRNNIKGYLSYPLYKEDCKVIPYVKSDNFYQYNLFWDVVVNKSVPLFVRSCESLSVDKILNQPNMDYSQRNFRKYTIRGKDIRIRHILDNASDLHLVSQLLLVESKQTIK
ncbi:MAG: hypothetical protein NZZ41_05065 [Candidatus Dojkabacteria bacterium]|nr:hypothetical protein [Candidatus Dojkabacteria bacterium]